MSSVVVIGAGISGLSAAYRLREAGFAVTVLEEKPAPGGRLADLRDGDIAYNAGARLLYPFGRALWALIRDLGLEQALVPIRDLSASCRIGDAEYRLELMPTARTLRLPGLTALDRLRLVAFAARLALLRHRVDPDDLVSGLEFDDETLASFARRTLGARATKRLIDPLFRGTRSWDPETISAAFLLTTLPHMLGRRTVFSFAQGMGQLTRTLSARLDVRCRSRVVSVERNADLCRVDLADGTAIDTDLVVIAVEGARALALLPRPEPAEAQFFAGLRYNGVGVVHYAVAGDVAPAMRFIDARESASIATFQQLPASPRAGRPRAQLFCQLTPEASAAAQAGGRTGHLDRIIRGDLRRLFPEIDAREVACTEQWIEYKLPLPYPGFGRHMKRFRDGQAATPRRIYFCGDYLAQPLVNGACASGEDVARLIAAHWPKQPPCRPATTPPRAGIVALAEEQRS